MPPRLQFPARPTSTLRSVFPRLNPAPAKRTLVSAPKANSGPLMERRPDRALPSIDSNKRWMRTLPVFALVMGVSMFAIFNYQKQSSSIVTSTLYSLRTNPRAREILGDEVYFASQIPWIKGEMNQLHGRINIRFWVKGKKRQALMRFRSERRQRMGFFDTLEWSLEMEDGTVVNLLDATTPDPFKQTPMEEEILAQQQAV